MDFSRPIDSEPTPKSGGVLVGSKQTNKQRGGGAPPNEGQNGVRKGESHPKKSRQRSHIKGQASPVLSGLGNGRWSEKVDCPPNDWGAVSVTLVDVAAALTDWMQ
jgi:hypothetical protein